MRFLLLIATLLCCSIAEVQAQQLTVRSGDHQTFSRITLPVIASQRWEVSQTERGIELTLPGHSGGFDVSTVFLRMRRDRITQITATEGMLTLRVDCACSATAFRSGPLLVIDVADEGTELAGPPLKGPALSTAQQSRVTARIALNSTAQLPWIGSASPYGPSMAIDTTLAKSSATTAPKPTPDDRAALLKEIQKNLSQSVASAASNGLLEKSYESRPTPKQPTEIADVTPEIPPAALPDSFRSISQNLRITSSMDLPNGIRTHSVNATTAGIACPKAGILALETWGTEGGFSAQLGPARTALMDGRDRLDREAAKSLSQLYLYFGFGAEALDALQLDSSLVEANPHLASVAKILEFGSVSGHNPLGAYTDCGSDVSLWATLSFRHVPKGILIDTNAALRALNKLPEHLRQVVAPSLSERLLQYGDSEAAAASIRSIERLPTPLAPEAVMAQAGLVIDAGQSAETLLEDVIATNSRESPAALVKLVEGKLAKDEPLSYKTATLIEAYAQELRGTEMGNQLRRAQVLALSQSEHFEEAFSTLDALSPSLSPTAATQLRQTALDRLTQKAEDIVFLEHFFAQDAADLGNLSTKTKLKLSSRLMDLGFASEVQIMLETTNETPRDSARQLLAARAALALRHPFQAQAALIGIDGSEAQLLMAQAKEMAGSYREASEIFTNSNATAQAAQAAWLSDEWRELTPAQTPGFGPVATLAQVEPVNTNVELGPLGRANKALEESSAARGTLEQFLSDPIVQFAPDS